MSWIPTVDPADATGPLKRIYDASLEKFGFVPNIRRILSTQPTLLRSYMQLSGVAYSGNCLDPIERELIATVVSNINGCHY